MNKNATNVGDGLQVRQPRRRLAHMSGTLSFVLLIVLVPLLFGDRSYILSIATLSLMYVAIAVGFNLVYGYTGLMSFAQVGFIGIGGYTAAILTTRLGIDTLLAVVLAAVFTGLVALLVGAVTVPLSQEAFVIITLSVTLLCRLLAGDWKDLTNGWQGIVGLPRLTVVSTLRQFVSGSDVSYYWVFGAWAVVVVGGLRLLTSSRAGRLLIAIRDNEPLARSQGFNTNRIKLFVFVLGAVITGITGALHTFSLTTIDPSIFEFSMMQALLIMVIIGGAGSFWPVVCAAVVLTVIPELLQAAEQARLVIFGVVLIVTLILMPQGFGGFLKERRMQKQYEVSAND